MGPQNPGDVLLSHRVAPAVPSALESLTSVFGMGTGVTSPALSPGKQNRSVKHGWPLASDLERVALGDNASSTDEVDRYSHAHRSSTNIVMGLWVTIVM